MKKCAKCHEIKSIEYFSKDKSRKDGLNKYCRQCASKIYEENKKIILEKQHEYYVKNKTTHLEKCQQWYQNNLDRRKEYRKKYYNANREENLSYSKKLSKDHPEYTANANQIHKVRKHGGIVEKIDRKKIIERDNSTCQVCGKILLPKEITIDHILPISKGGGHIESNLRVTCRYCNCCRRYNKHP